jgi:hypothetical protein
VLIPFEHFTDINHRCGITVAFHIPLFIYGKSPGLPQCINFLKLKEGEIRKSAVTLLMSFIEVASQNTDPHYETLFSPLILLALGFAY